jgi:hypothetical protein
MDNLNEDESDSDDSEDQDNGSETEDHESQTSEDDDEIDLTDLKLNEDSITKSLYSSSSGMVWSSTPHHLTKINLSNDPVKKSGLTKITKDISSFEDAFNCFMSEKVTQKILMYSNMEYTRNIASDEKPQEITMMELKAFIGLLLLAGLLQQSKRNIKCLWRRSPLESPIFKATMSRRRFQKISSCLRFDDKKTREERKRTDKFAAIREIWSYFQDNLKTCYIQDIMLTSMNNYYHLEENVLFVSLFPKSLINMD